MRVACAYMGLVALTSAGCGPDPVPADGTGGGTSDAASATSTAAADASSAASTTGTDVGSSGSGDGGGAAGTTTATSTTSGGGAGGEGAAGGTGPGGAGGDGGGGGGGGGGAGGGAGQGSTSSTDVSASASSTTASASTGAECDGAPDDTSCTGGLCCGGACIAADDVEDCRACGNACGLYEVCGATDCELDCEASGLEECDGECIDLGLDDPENCGDCNRSCGEMTCTDGACDAEAVLEGDVAIGGMAVGDDVVFASLYDSGTSQGASILRYTPSTSTVATELTSNRVWSGVLVDGNFLAAAEYPGLGMRRCAVGDCLATLSDPIGSLRYFHGAPSLELAGGFVFGKSYNASLTIMHLSQCSASTCATRFDLPSSGFAMSASDSRVFFSDGSAMYSTAIRPLGQPMVRTLYRSDLTGSAFQVEADASRVYVWEADAMRITSGNMAASPGPISIDATTVRNVFDLEAADGSVYWACTTPELAVEACEVANCAATRRVLGRLAPGNVYASIAVDASHVYVRSEYETGQSPPKFGRIFRVPR